VAEIDVSEHYHGAERYHSDEDLLPNPGAGLRGSLVFVEKDRAMDGAHQRLLLGQSLIQALMLDVNLSVARVPVEQDALYTIAGTLLALVARPLSRGSSMRTLLSLCERMLYRPRRPRRYW
jgi:hypothetical protein